MQMKDFKPLEHMTYPKNLLKVIGSLLTVH